MTAFLIFHGGNSIFINSFEIFISIFLFSIFLEGREGVKWELGFAFFRDWEMGFCALGLGFIKQKQ